MDMTGLFVAGTDTGVGKTLVSAALLYQWSRAGYACAGMKPVATGAILTEDGLRNDDAAVLMQAGSVQMNYAWHNPCVFADPVAPHLASMEAGCAIDLKQIKHAYHRLRSQTSRIVVEGVGGWSVPIDNQRTMADVVRMLGLPVILVVGIRLGCINHALLTVSAIQNSGSRLCGWIANTIDPNMPFLEGNITTLVQSINAPLLRVIPWQKEQNALLAANNCPTIPWNL